MCSYNKVNGTYACENSHLLNDVLKNDWQFQGQVQSDWGAAHSTAPAINAGLDEEEDVGATVYLTPAAVQQARATYDVALSMLDVAESVCALALVARQQPPERRADVGRCIKIDAYDFYIGRL